MVGNLKDIVVAPVKETHYETRADWNFIALALHGSSLQNIGDRSI